LCTVSSKVILGLGWLVSTTVLTTVGRGFGVVLEGGAGGFGGTGFTVEGGLALVWSGWGEVTSSFGPDKAGFDSATVDADSEVLSCSSQPNCRNRKQVRQNTGPIFLKKLRFIFSSPIKTSFRLPFIHVWLNGAFFLFTNPHDILIQKDVEDKDFPARIVWTRFFAAPCALVSKPIANHISKKT
jgi:hypothetical protein